ncbi:MAG TPA: GAF domain-containing protein [Candidatus Limnocylindrales bacterium]|nr:GAF domain-containing protein [Candidatus Limnocylindrales bacterium]
MSKRYYSPRQLLRVCQELLAAFSPANDASPFDDVLKLLYDHRKYFWIGIYFVLGDKVVRQAMQGPMPPCHVFEFGKGNVGTTGQSGLVKVIPDVTADATYSMCFLEVKSEIVVPIRIGGRTLGVIDVESDCPNNFGSLDRMLLEGVAAMLARFLTSRGKVLVRHARERQDALPKARHATAC